MSRQLQQPPSLAHGLNADRLPAMLAVQARQVDAAVETRSKLNALLHLFENLLRLTTALAIGELRRTSERAPDQVALAMLLGLTNPTHETWIQRARHAAKLLGSDAIVPTLRQDIEDLSTLTKEVKRRRNR
jgi:hypothetical protein